MKNTKELIESDKSSKEIVGEMKYAPSRTGVGDIERLEKLMKNFFNVDKKDFVRLTQNKRDFEIVKNHFEGVNNTTPPSWNSEEGWYGKKEFVKPNGPMHNVILTYGGNI